MDVVAPPAGAPAAAGMEHSVQIPAGTKVAGGVWGAALGACAPCSSQAGAVIQFPNSATGAMVQVTVPQDYESAGLLTVRA